MSWLRDTWKTVIGAASSVAPQPPGSGNDRQQVSGSAPGQGADGGGGGGNDVCQQASQPNEGLTSSWSGAGHYFKSVKATVEEKLGKDVGFMMVDKAEASQPRGDYEREKADIEAKCKALLQPSAKDIKSSTNDVWKTWLDRLRMDTSSRFFDAQADDNVSFQQILLASSAVETAVKCLLKDGHNTVKEDSPVVKLLEGCLVGDPTTKRRILMELVKMGEVIDGTSAQDQITKMACSAFVEARVDLRYEEKVWEVSELLQQVRIAEQEDAKGIPMEDDDLELRRRVQRSSELLDKNATMRHLVSVARSLLEGRNVSSGVVGGVQAQIQALAKTARENNETASNLLESALKEKSSVSEDAERGRCKLEEQDGELTERLDRLHERRRELQNELDRIMGEILGAEQQQAELSRERELLGRMATQKAKSLEETMQALSVQMQDYDNEEDALEDSEGFFGMVFKMVAEDAAAQAKATEKRMREVLFDQHSFLERHLSHQIAQLQLLESCLCFCVEEQESMRARAESMKHLGMSDMASEEGERMRKLEEKREETVRRIHAIDSDARDIKQQAQELSSSVGREFPGDPAMLAAMGRISGLITCIMEQLAEAGLSSELDEADDAVLVPGGRAMPTLDTSNLAPTGGQVRVLSQSTASHSTPPSQHFGEVLGRGPSHFPPPSHPPPAAPAVKADSPASPVVFLLGDAASTSASLVSPPIPLIAPTLVAGAASPTHLMVPRDSLASPNGPPPIIPPQPPLFDLQRGSILLAPLSGGAGAAALVSPDAVSDVKKSEVSGVKKDSHTNVKEETPADNKEETPADNKEETPADNKEETPADNKEETPADNKEETPADNKEETPADNKETTEITELVGSTMSCVVDASMQGEGTCISLASMQVEGSEQTQDKEGGLQSVSDRAESGDADKEGGAEESEGDAARVSGGGEGNGKGKGKGRKKK